MTSEQSNQLQAIYDLITETEKPQIYIPNLYYNGSYGCVTDTLVSCSGYNTCTIGSISSSGGTFYVYLYADESGSAAISNTNYTSGSNITIDVSSADSIKFRFVDSGSVYNNVSVSNIKIF